MFPLNQERSRWAVAAGIALASALVAWWLSTFDLSGGRGLFVFFLYSVPCEFLVSLAPHDPAVLYMARDHAPVVVALVGGAGTLVAESVNYELLRRLSGSSTIAGFSERRSISQLADSFARAPFATLWIAGFIPTIPFSAIRLFVLVREYPRGRYLVAAVSSRTLRFYLVALLGYVLRPSPQVIAILFVALILLVTLPGVYTILAQRRLSRISRP
jgi:membrane protein DedA with SNARE-associated domain